MDFSSIRGEIFDIHKGQPSTSRAVLIESPIDLFPFNADSNRETYSGPIITPPVISSFENCAQSCILDSSVEAEFSAPQSISTSSTRGRKRKAFAEVGTSSRYARAKEIRKQYSQEELKYALTKETMNELASTIALTSGPFSKEDQDKGLSIFLEMNGTKRNWQSLRNFILGGNKIPPYNCIKYAKERCCPPFTATEKGCYVEPQILMDLTTSRLLPENLPKGVYKLIQQAPKCYTTKKQVNRYIRNRY